MPLDRSGKTKASPYRFQPLTEKERRGFSQREKEVRKYQKERQSRETRRRDMPETKSSKRLEPNKEKFSRSPIMDRPNKKPARKKAPPARYETPKPNPNVEPLKRKDDLSRSWDKSLRSDDRGQKSEVREKRSMSRDQTPRKRGERSEDRMQKLDERQQKGNDKRQKWNER